MILTGCTSKPPETKCYFECWTDKENGTYCWWHNTKTHGDYITENACEKENDND